MPPNYPLSHLCPRKPQEASGVSGGPSQTTPSDLPQTGPPGVPRAGICLQSGIYLTQSYGVLGMDGGGEAKANNVGPSLTGKFFSRETNDYT